ncbi:hypothetical protein IC220_03000 [Wolbachia endosymbiont of Pentalonia nigronervosa]|uniref:hypothetical protein n=1 Tax=Wolbachia endosymbiont of Pentalonia nigronervosa TaxID=1301914 RepID=UPI00165F6C1D|nr:hypothetical protein [Wolbachia endosymbiont of Pentalonia nigronervosa]MBD0391427.1 hypothetical protein [Wolbachia endosymbiont of Pentalonia nigronervosa]
MTTSKDLEQKFEKVFRHSPSPFSADFSLEDKANYLKAGNDMLKAQAAEKLEAQVKDIASKQQEIARRKAAFDKETRQNLERIDQAAGKAGLLNNPANNDYVAKKQPEKDDTSAKTVAAEVDNGNASKVHQKQPEKDDTSAKTVAQKVESANPSRKSQAQTYQQSREARKKHFAEKQEARIARAHQNAEIIYKKAEALAHNIEAFAGRVYNKLGKLNSELNELQPEEKARAEKIRQKIERIEKKANDLGLLDNPEINAALAEKTHQRIERLEKKAEGLLDNPKENLDLANRVQKKLGELNATLEVIDKQQAKAPDLSKSLGEAESQESSQEDKGLFNRVIQFVQRMFRNVLTEVINDYRAKNSVAVHGNTQNNQGKSDIRMVQGGSNIVYNTSFVRINKQELPLEPGQDFHHQSNGVDIRITYNTQKTVPAMNLNINGTECTR